MRSSAPDHSNLLVVRYGCFDTHTCCSLEGVLVLYLQLVKTKMAQTVSLRPVQRQSRFWSQRGASVSTSQVVVAPAVRLAEVRAEQSCPWSAEQYIYLFFLLAFVPGNQFNLARGSAVPSCARPLSLHRQAESHLQPLLCGHHGGNSLYRWDFNPFSYGAIVMQYIVTPTSINVTSLSFHKTT